jgi:hypothetical protein
VPSTLLWNIRRSSTIDFTRHYSHCTSGTRSGWISRAVIIRLIGLLHHIFRSSSSSPFAEQAAVVTTRMTEQGVALHTSTAMDFSQASSDTSFRCIACWSFRMVIEKEGQRWDWRTDRVSSDRLAAFRLWEEPAESTLGVCANHVGTATIPPVRCSV